MNLYFLSFLTTQPLRSVWGTIGQKIAFGNVSEHVSFDFYIWPTAKESGFHSLLAKCRQYVSETASSYFSSFSHIENKHFHFKTKVTFPLSLLLLFNIKLPFPGSFSQRVIVGMHKKDIYVQKNLFRVHVTVLCTVYQPHVHMAVANRRFNVIFLHRNKLKSGKFTVQLDGSYYVQSSCAGKRNHV